MEIDIVNNICSLGQSPSKLIDSIQVKNYFVNFDMTKLCWKVNGIYLSEKMSMKILIELKKKYGFLFKNQVNIEKYSIIKNLLLKELVKLYLCNDLLNLLFLL